MWSIRRALVLVVVCWSVAVSSPLLTSCSKALVPPTASVELASAGVAVGAEVALDGSASSDPNGLPLQYRWRVAGGPTGSSAEIHAADTANAWITPDLPGDYTIELVVSDGTLTSAPATATLTAGPCGANVPVVGAIASAPAAPATGDVVVLAAAATDADMAPACTAGDALVWHWTIASQPVGSTATLDHADAQTPSFVPDQPGAYVVRATVTDRAGHSVTAEATLDVGGCGVVDGRVASVSATPATPDSGGLVTLSAVVEALATPDAPDAGTPDSGAADGGANDAGDAAADADAGPPVPACTDAPHFTYHWTLVAVPTGSSATLVDSPQISPTFVADMPGSYTAELYVDNARGRTSNVRSVTVVAGACGSHAPALANVKASPASPTTGSSVALTATVSDADTSAPCNLTEHLSLVWALVSVPAGSSATLSGTDQSSPWFSPDIAGKYSIQVFARDAAGHDSDVETLNVTATLNKCGSAAPVIASITASPASTQVGGGISLTTSVTDADTGGTCQLAENFSYAWALTAVPSGSVAALIAPTSPLSGFSPDKVGTYIVSLVVTDGEGHASVAVTKNVSATAASTCGTASPVARLGSVIAGPCSGACTATTISPVPPALPGGSSPYVVTMNGHASLRLDATASTDPDNSAACNAKQALFYSWTILAAPIGSAASWDIGAGGSTTVATPTLALDVKGVYVVELVVSDGNNSSAPLDVQISY